MVDANNVFIVNDNDVVVVNANGAPESIIRSTPPSGVDTLSNVRIP
jgi:hypothetical protein